MKLGKMCFVSLQKLFSFTKTSKFRILNIQISWSHEMPKHKNKEHILLNNLGSKHGLLMEFGQFMSHHKRKKFAKKFYKNCNLKTSPRSFYVCKELNTTSSGKWNLWSKLLIYIRYIIAKLSRFVQISMQTSSHSFLQRILWKLKTTCN